MNIKITIHGVDHYIDLTDALKIVKQIHEQAFPATKDNNG